MADEEKGDQTELTEEQKQQAEEKKQDETKQWDKEKQRADQAQANVDKLVGERAQFTEQLESVSGELVAAKEQQAETVERLAKIEESLTTKAKAEEIDDIDNIDPDLVDPNVIKVIKGFKTEIADLNEKLKGNNEVISDLQKTKTQYEEDRKQSEEDTARDARKEKILKKCDDEFGVKYRNEAVKLAKKKVAETGEAPKDAVDAYSLLRDCYKEIAKKGSDSGETKKGVRVDTGAGGVVFKEGDIKEGYNEDVMPQIKEKIKSGGFEMPTT
jgi:DNA repair exonuclease SbcCD ATPase subunit